MASVVGTYARAFADVVMQGHVSSPADAPTDAFVRPTDRSQASAHSHLDPTRALQELHSIEALMMESDQLRRVLENPSIPGDRKRAVLDAITARLGAARQVRNFVAVLTDHRRLPLFSEILKQLERELDDRQGFAEAQVRTARPLADQEKQLLEAEITKLTGKGVKAKYEQDATLLGGAVVQIGSTIYDGSVKGQLEQIREKLVEA
jgi:F-type H+-transporting ATPase subunit delta